MKKFILLTISWLIVNTCVAQNADFTIICPENTFLGNFNCSNINDVPPLINSIEDVLAAPYNIQFEGSLPAYISASTVDDGVIYFCEGDPRIINREIIFFKDISPSDEVIEEIGRCSFTIETTPDLTAPEFLAPPNKEINCDNPEMIVTNLIKLMPFLQMK